MLIAALSIIAKKKKKKSGNSLNVYQLVNV